MNEQIKVGFCIAYDWYLLKYSLPLVYEHASKICLSIDKDRISWSGNKYTFDEKAFLDLIKQVDVQKKISVLEDDYHQRDLTPMQNEVRQRNSLAKFQGEGGWHIQLDCDEYFQNFKDFVGYLRSLSHAKTRRANVSCAWLVLFKQLDDGFLYVDPVHKKNIELIQVATREPNYEYGRRNGNFNLLTNFILIHQSWARPYEEIVEKVNNWGHSTDFEKGKYLDFWKSLTKENFKAALNLHHLKPETWPRLKFIQAASVDELTLHDFASSFPAYSEGDLMLKNSKFFSRLRKIKNFDF